MNVKATCALCAVSSTPPFEVGATVGEFSLWLEAFAAKHWHDGGATLRMEGVKLVRPDVAVRLTTK